MDLRKSESLATKDSKSDPNGDGGARDGEKSPLDVLRRLEGVHVAEADTEQAEKILETDNLKKKEATAGDFKRSLKEALFQQRRSEASLDIESNLCVQQVNISQPVIKEADENKKEPEKNIRSSEDLPRNLELVETDFELKQQGERSQKDVSQQESQRPHKSTKTRPKVGEETEQDSSQSGRSKGRPGKGCDLSSSEQMDFSEKGDLDKVECPSDQLDMQEKESFDILEKGILPPNSDQLDISERNGLEQATCPSNSDQSGISEKGGSDKLQQTKCPPNPDCLDISDKLEQIKCPALPCQQQFTGVRQRVVYLLRTHLAKMHFHRCIFFSKYSLGTNFSIL